MTVVLFAARADLAQPWAEALSRWREELSVPFTLHTDPEAVDPAEVEVLVTGASGGPADFSPYAGARLIQSFWAGVEGFLANPTFPREPVFCRMVEPGLREGMTDYVCAHVLRAHVGLDRHVRDSAEGLWRPAAPPLSRDRKVGVLGLGALGADAARMLGHLRFDVGGWSRTPKHLDGVRCFSGDEGLRAILGESEIVVTLLPSTPATHHLLNAERLSWLPRGATIINPGRGQLIDDDALLAALASGQVAQATLDVFDTEPLPEGHPYWGHPQVTVTPHVAAETRIDTAARVVVEQIGRLQRGEPLRHIVDRDSGY